MPSTLTSLSFEHVAHLGERRRLHDTGAGPDGFDRVLRYQLGRAERTGPPFGDDERVGSEHRDDALVLALEVLQHPAQEQGQAEGDRRGQDGDDEATLAVEEVVQADAPHGLRGVRRVEGEKQRERCRASQGPHATRDLVGMSATARPATLVI